jgi:hypothetical protein
MPRVKIWESCFAVAGRFSDRYDAVLAKNADILTAVDPKWKKMGDYWNTVLPTAEDLDLQVNTIAHTEMVINLGSSMVFDYISYDKPALTSITTCPIQNNRLVGSQDLPFCTFPVDAFARVGTLD